MKHFNIFLTACFILFAFLFASCKKDFLDASPNASLAVPKTIATAQALLDNAQYFNTNQPCLGELATDDYLLLASRFNSLQPLEQNSYIWATDVFNSVTSVGDWDAPYESILYANEALLALSNVTPNASNIDSWNNVKGSALFYRGMEFFNLAQDFTVTYDSATAAANYGIPLKLSADVNEIAGRGTLQQTYQQIMSDIEGSIPYLPDLPLSANYYRPSKLAAYGMLSRIYLSLGNYNAVISYSDSCLSLNSQLMDFNTLNSALTYPVPFPNAEIDLFYVLAEYSGIARHSIVDSSLFNEYDSNDLRKTLYFSSTRSFRGDYYPYVALFGGLATDEIYLNRAEAYVREGEVENGINDLNTVLLKRYKTGKFTPYSITDQQQALSLILTERRKELVFRGTRWTDLRRLNTDPQIAISLTRYVNGQTYTLPPNDPRYVYPIPQDELLYNPVPQNQR